MFFNFKRSTRLHNGSVHTFSIATRIPRDRLDLVDFTISLCTQIYNYNDVKRVFTTSVDNTWTPLETSQIVIIYCARAKRDLLFDISCRNCTRYSQRVYSVFIGCRSCRLFDLHAQTTKRQRGRSVFTLVKWYDRRDLLQACTKMSRSTL